MLQFMTDDERTAVRDGGRAPSSVAGAPREGPNGNILFAAPPRKVSRRAAPRVDEAIMVAIDLLEEQGEQGFRISSVKERTGISIGSLYHHFGSRDGLIKAARAHQLAEVFRSDGAVLVQIVEESRSVEEFLAAMRSAAVEMTGDEARQFRLHRIEFIGSSVSRPDLFATVQELQTQAIDHVETAAEVLVARGWVQPAITARTLASMLLCVGLGRVICDLDEHGPTSEQWAECIDAALRGMLLAR